MTHDDLTFLLFGLALLSVIIAGTLFVIFGEVTVRKLRKNPETKKLLGMEFVSGWDIQNVAIAISLPRSFQRRVSNGSLSFLYANPDVIYRYTTKLDRFLGRAFFWMLIASVTWMVILAIVDSYA